MAPRQQVPTDDHKTHVRESINAQRRMDGLPPLKETPPLVDYVCGLRKVASRAGVAQYSLVVGKLIDGVFEGKVDSAAQPLEHAAEELRLAFQDTMKTIP